MVGAVAAPERCFGGQEAYPDAEVTLFCLPFAGGGSVPFRRWRPGLPVAVQVVPIHLPGREERIFEPARIDAGEVAEAIIAWTGRSGRPFAIYGHSLGGRLGFEVVGELGRRGAGLPVRLYVGGARPPEGPEPLAYLADLADGPFVTELNSLGGTPAGVLDNPELRELLLPLLRADFRWVADYRTAVAAPVPVPIVAVVGRTDQFLDAVTAIGWRRNTSAGLLVQTVPGDHFSCLELSAPLADLLGADLLAAVRAPGTSRPVGPPGADSVHLWLAAAGRADDVVARVRARYDEPLAAGLQLGRTGRGGSVLVAATAGEPAVDLPPVDDPLAVRLWAAGRSLRFETVG